ncbi:hypothetical protein Lcho_4068 [Leptothrix cholodnii SP-6]|uniref:Uncharacterized protein n=1 Tax=Leptothrix cholodnii (strain ATCC 51168 / LMG 8142 / SP-6) TaxID=395495 RepID=B1XWX1_LEPCP|nr:hypothetical protein [Leptothrix cholodnii]ACB36320.1 hypothetical protein Lcho_4068 [Leptothrix cholodnii SP-6]
MNLPLSTLLPGNPAYTLLALVAVLLLVLALHARWRHGRWTDAARTWLLIVGIFVAVIVWGRLHGP